MMIRTVFSWDILIDGVHFGNSEILSADISCSAGGIGKSGCVSACLKVSLVNGGMDFSDNAEVVVTNDLGFSCQKFYIDTRSVSFDGGVTELVCYDKLNFSDIAFDYSGFVSGSEGAVKVAVGNVLSVVSSQLGVSVGDVPFSGKEMDLSQLKDRTVRDVLNLISEQNVGYWFINESGNLEFAALGGYSAVLPIVKNGVISGGTVKEISRVIMRDSLDGKEYDTLGGTSQADMLIVSAEDVDSSMASAVLERVKEKVFKAFSCSCQLSGFGRVYSDFGGLIVSSVSQKLTAGGIFGTVGAGSFGESEYDFGGFYRTQLDRRIAKNALYNNCAITTDKGFVFYDYEEA